MKLSLISNIRNEQNMLAAFLNHIDALFDDVLLIDHQSVDATSRILKDAVAKRKNWQYFFMRMSGYYQKEVATWAMGHLFDKGADCVFFLDGDEFFLVQNREELEINVKQISESKKAGSFRWRNYLPDSLSGRQFRANTPIWQIKQPSRFEKVCIPKLLYENYEDQLLLSQGNHLVNNQQGDLLPSVEIGYIAHIPVQSRQQFTKKAIQSSIANLMRTTRNPGEGYQFREMLDVIANKEMSEDFIRGAVLLYQGQLNITPISRKELKNSDYIKTSLAKLRVAMTRSFSFRINRDNHFIEKLIAEQLLSLREEGAGKLHIDEKQGLIYLE